jgi:hypothetical protein
MADESHLDLQYFIDNHKYNCPFCNRRHVAYHVFNDRRQFDWSEGKPCYVYFVRCDSCLAVSMHLTFQDLDTYEAGDSTIRRFKAKAAEDLDSKFFYSVPSSFFVMDNRIPAVIRELITEAESCKKMNFLTGASACARKAIYEFLVKENAEGEHYEDKIKALKKKFPAVDDELFDVLSHIQSMTSDKVHEQSWPKWDARNLTLIIETLKAILHEVYVVPEEKKGRSTKIQQLLESVKEGKKP